MAGLGEDLAPVVDHLPAAQRVAHAARGSLALEEVVVDVHVRGPRRELERGGRVEDHEVGVLAGGDRALAREAEAPGDRGRGHVDQLLGRDPPALHAQVPQLHQPVLDHRQPVGDLREVVAAERLLLAVERAVVGGHALQHSAVERRPQQLLVVGLAQRRRAHVAGSLEVGPLQVVDGVGQVLQAGLSGHGHAARLAGGDLVGGQAAGHVHDVDAGAGQLREAHRAVGRLGLERLGAGMRVVDGVGLARGQRALHEHVDGPAVLAVDHGQRAQVARVLEHPQEQVVGDHQHAAVGQEDLEGADALGDHRLHVGEGALVGLGDRHVEAVVDVRRAVGPVAPFLQRGAQAVGVLLNHEVDDAGGSSRRGRARARVVVVDRAGAAERHRHVRVVVDQPGQHEAAGGVDHLRVDVA